MLLLKCLPRHVADTWRDMLTLPLSVDIKYVFLKEKIRASLPCSQCPGMASCVQGMFSDIAFYSHLAILALVSSVLLRVPPRSWPS